MSLQTPLGNEVTAAQEIEWSLDCWFAKQKGVAPKRGLMRFMTPDCVVDSLIDFWLLQNLHLTALRRISEALGHPLKDVKEKTCLDLADLAVARIKSSDDHDELAHSLAFEQASGLIDGCTGIERDGEDAIEMWWQNTADVAEVAGVAEEIAQAVRYLDARGLIERHPDHPDWVRVRDESEATR